MKYRLLEAVIEKIIEPICERHGFAVYRIITHWDKIVGRNLARLSYPLKVIYERGQKTGGMLIIEINNPGFILELQAAENLIISRIAVYFGYQAVSKIKIKVVKQISTVNQQKSQDRSTLTSKVILTPDQDRALLSSLEQLEDSELKETLLELKFQLFQV